MTSRRDFIKQVIAIGGLGTLPIPTAVAQAIAQASAETASDSAAERAFSVLAMDQANFLSQLADHIIPATDTPSASEAGVVKFIDTLLARWYEPPEVREFLQGLNLCQEQASSPLTTHYVTVLDSQSFKSNPPASTPQSDFYRMAKELVLVGYFTSKSGSVQNLHTHGPVGNYSFEPSGPPGDPIKY